MSDKPGLLGTAPARHFKIYREHFPAIFRFNGTLYMEDYDIDANTMAFVEITEAQAEPWLKAKEPTNAD